MKFCYCADDTAGGNVACSDIGDGDILIATGASEELVVGRVSDDGLPIVGAELKASMVGYRFVSLFSHAFAAIFSNFSANRHQILSNFVDFVKFSW